MLLYAIERTRGITPSWWLLLDLLTPFHRIQVLDPEGQFKFKFGTKGFGQEKFSQPACVAIDLKGNIVVVDPNHNMHARCQIFTSSGTFLWSFGNEPKHEICTCHGIAIDSKGRFILSDQAHHVIQIFSPSGEWIQDIGEHGRSQSCHFEYPWAVFVDKEDRIVVMDNGNCRVQILSSDGKFLTTFGSKGKEGSPAGQMYYPKGGAIDKQGNIIVSDYSNCRIQIFGPKED